MATMDEYKAVHAGKEPPGGLEHGTELGHGGCNVISKDSGGVVGRWGSWETASVALNRLQRLGGHGMNTGSRSPINGCRGRNTAPSAPSAAPTGRFRLIPGRRWELTGPKCPMISEVPSGGAAAGKGQPGRASS